MRVKQRTKPSLPSTSLDQTKQSIVACTSRSCKLLQVPFWRPSLAAFSKPNNSYVNPLSSRNLISANEVVHLITFYTPLWGAILYNGFTYYQVNRMLSNATRMAVGISDSSYRLDSWAGRKAVNKWGYYPLILIGSWAFATMNRIFDFLHPDHKIFWLSVADVWFAGLMGLFNSIAYGLNSSVRQAIAERLDMYLPEKFKRLFPQALKSQEQQQELASLMVEGG